LAFIKQPNNHRGLRDQAKPAAAASPFAAGAGLAISGARPFDR
jgi:hypothetical protein